MKAVNPVMEALLYTRATERLQALGYDAPSSWTKEAKLRFLELPADLQVYLVAREKQRDGEVRRSQREAAELRKSLAAAEARIAELEQTKQEPSDGIQQTTAT